ncbi:MAG: hypothetical protein F6K31_39515 [Symploca sp. SIO2G7]|nr:hypothetical protein [Symploca sp. SIO2G7]
MSNRLIVESKNDKHFIQSIVNCLNCDLEDEDIIYIDEDNYKILGGLDPAKLKKELSFLRDDAQKKDINKVGIIIDIDQFSKEERLNFINDCINQVFTGSEILPNTGEFIQIAIDDETRLQLSCYFTNANGKGELETVLRAIKNKDSTYADCLESWKSCIESKGKQIKIKDFDKFWVSTYLRYDTCSGEEQKQAGKKCSMVGFDYVMKNKTDIWDLTNPVLDELKDFLKLFC